MLLNLKEKTNEEIIQMVALLPVKGALLIDLINELNRRVDAGVITAEDYERLRKEEK